MPITAWLEPLSFADGADVTIRVDGLLDHSGRDLSITVGRTDSIESGWAASTSASVQSDGTVTVTIPEVHLGREAALFVAAVKVGDIALELTSTRPSIVNPAVVITSADEAAARRDELKAMQEARYRRPVGDPAAPGAIEYSVLCAIERLLVTRRIPVVGGMILPVAERPDGGDQRHLLNAALAQSGFPLEITEAPWASRIQDNRPWTVIVFPSLWAPDLNAASLIAWEKRNDLLSALGLNRGARGRPVATVILPTAQHGADAALYVEDEVYGGNLLGGFIAGEEQAEILAQQAALQMEPVLRLCTDLYSEALADPSPDARYFRFWSIVETLSFVRLPTPVAVTRSDGTPWPGNSNTTAYVKPRVYRFLLDWLTSRSVDEASFARPAANLYDAVNVWYARRNATAHYGRFVPSDATQKAQRWFSDAVLSITPPQQAQQWLQGLRGATASVLRWELYAVGSSAVV